MTLRRSSTADEKMQFVLKVPQARGKAADIGRHHGNSSTAFSESREGALASVKNGLVSKEGTIGTVLRYDNARPRKLIADYARADDGQCEYLEGPSLGKDDGRS